MAAAENIFEGKKKQTLFSTNRQQIWKSSKRILEIPDPFLKSWAKKKKNTLVAGIKEML